MPFIIPKSPHISRRRFLGHGAAAASLLGVWSAAEAAPPNSPTEKLNLGLVGVGHRGIDNMEGVKGENIVALCDVDRQYLEKIQWRFPDAAVYRDFRQMFERPDLDGVVISTPDHTHFHAAMMALRRGLHVYCERPLAQTIDEVRRLAAEAEMRSLATQMGNQHHNSDGYCRVVEWVQSGELGQVREVHVWTNRPLWPQGLQRSDEQPPIPPNLEWDLWLGPAPWRPYHPSYHPMTWRGWWDFGAGALGDMGPHLIDPAFRALQLAPPTSVQAESSPVTDESAPEWSIVEFEFAARGDLPPVKLIWYDGGKKPPAEAIGTANPPKNGALLIGERGSLFVPERGGKPLILARDPQDRPQPPQRTLPDSPGHYAEWIAACKGGPPASSSFPAAVDLMETCLLGNVALRAGEAIRWDRENTTTGGAQADQFLRRTYREGWEL